MNASNWNHTKTNIRRALNRNTNPVIVGKDDSANTPVNATELPPGFMWVRRQQANGTFGPPFIVQGSTSPGANQPGIPVEIGVDARTRNTIRNVNYIQTQALGINPTQYSTIDPNTNNNLFVNQSFITTAYANIIAGTLTVGIRRWLPIQTDTIYSVGGTADWIADFTGNVPSAGNHCLAVIAVLPDWSALEITYSTAKDIQIPLDLSDVQEAITAGTSGATRLWAFSLADAQTTLTEADRWADLRDPWNHPDNGGGSGTVTSVTAGTGLTATPNPIVGAGTIALDNTVYEQIWIGCL